MVFPATSFSRSPELFTSGLHRKVATPRESIRIGSQRIGWALVGACGVWAAAGPQRRQAKCSVVGRARAGLEAAKNEVAGWRQRTLSRGGALRFKLCDAPGLGSARSAFRSKREWCEAAKGHNSVGEHSPGQGHEKERKHAAGPPLTKALADLAVVLDHVCTLCAMLGAPKVSCERVDGLQRRGCYCKTDPQEMRRPGV